MKKFSVSMAVYQGDNSEHFKIALESVYNQTVAPNEVVLVVDGPIPNETQQVIAQFLTSKSNLKVIRLEQNMGHAQARRAGMEHCANELIALMDADDISLPNRFQDQLECFERMHDCAVIGGLIAEFSGNSKPSCIRRVPQYDKEIKQYLKSRCPFNQSSVMLKKSAVLAAGGYQDWYHNEDYFLWIRLSLAGAKFYNLQKVLVNMRAGSAMYERRGGRAYFASEYKLQRYMLKRKVISPFRFLVNVGIRIIVQLILSNKLREVFYKLFAREKAE